ncbi:uncharacterized protein LOC133306342 [Gastrolobium bilobum]|uniref:uncharacterized protein LOC133306342 n=1 Tax=Gastrolobium bilobum TaxID=150636 RepID=UPI002AB056E3|nr:uncharacterized protein LOC133306342 [Gastrolobium bilobum]
MDDWRNFFFLACNFLWNWRNSEIHDVDFSRPANPKICIVSLMNQIILSKTHASSWTRPEPGIVKLKVDGAVMNEKATCGGLLRDFNGSWLGGRRKSEVESDSFLVVNSLTYTGNDTQKFPLVNKIRVLFDRDWSVCISHVPRACNNCADWLAKEAFNNNYGLSSFSSPQPDLKNLLPADCLDPGDITSVIFT